MELFGYRASLIELRTRFECGVSVHACREPIHRFVFWIVDLGVLVHARIRTDESVRSKAGASRRDPGLVRE